ncbi:outer membrane protein [Ruegeria arenilitoris]|uniref:outer membrane protein n=1 Tax=Ruegeria arenilitoris TaxID=1173585 RepID=UPI0014816750|nr:outer membrane beta-barrel protein [Ruegeria arenilitoris]
MVFERSSLLTVVVAVSMIGAVPARAQEAPYVTGFLGITDMGDYDFDFFQTIPSVVVGQGTITTDNGVTYGLAVGLRFASNLRAEFELSYASNDAKEIGRPFTQYDGSFDATFGMANLWYDVPVQGRFKPYVGGGLGFARVSHDGQSGAGVTLVDDSDTAIAGQLGFGGRFQVGERGNIDIGYRYKTTGDLDFTTTQVFIPTDLTNGRYSSHSLILGYSYSF